MEKLYLYPESMVVLTETEAEKDASYCGYNFEPNNLVEVRLATKQDIDEAYENDTQDKLIWADVYTDFGKTTLCFVEVF